MLTKCVQLLCVTAVLVAVYFPARHARHYYYVTLENVFEEIVLRAPGTALLGSENCSYRHVILDNQEIPVSEITENIHFVKPLPGGEYYPRHCTPLIKTAVIIPYRNRTEQLNVFVKYMHKFLQNQNIHYRLILAVQNDLLPFNRARLINFGAHLAIALNYSCLILHDVDLIPLTTGNLYGCSKRPRHMSSSLDTFRYNLPYLTLFGGATAILADQFRKVNGMSNSFYGWGGEDDDLYGRLEAHKLLPYRFTPELSKYTMLVHKKQPKNDDRFKKLGKSIENRLDGLNTLLQKYSVYLEDLYTKVVPTSH